MGKLDALFWRWVGAAEIARQPGFATVACWRQDADRAWQRYVGELLSCEVPR